MKSWGDLVQRVSDLNEANGLKLLQDTLHGALGHIAKLRGSAALLYSSAFLQKSLVPPTYTSIVREDLNGFMACIYGMAKETRKLTIILHTPGGELAATQTIVDYLHKKFTDIEVIVPCFAMSAGTMISLGSNRVILGRQSQLGPIDPQLVSRGSQMSAQSILAQFEEAKKDIQQAPQLANLWAPILGQITPSLLMQAKNASTYGEKLVAGWLRDRMFAGERQRARKSAAVAKYFNDESHHLLHGSRVSYDQAKAVGVKVELMEESQALQDAVMLCYHAATLLFEKTTVTKLLATDHQKRWVKHFTQPAPGTRQG